MIFGLTLEEVVVCCSFCCHLGAKLFDFHRHDGCRLMVSIFGHPRSGPPSRLKYDVLISNC